MKTCTECGSLKPFTEFSPHKMGIGGVRSICKPCSVQQVLAYRKTDAGKATYQRAAKKYRQTINGYAHKVAWARANAQKDPAKYMLIRARVRAKAKGIPFSIQKSDIVVPEYCPVFGFKLMVYEKAFHQAGFSGNDCSMSLDRINPKFGYVPGNVAVISWRANRLKKDASLEELQLLLAYRLQTESLTSIAGK